MGIYMLPIFVSKYFIAFIYHQYLVKLSFIYVWRFLSFYHLFSLSLSKFPFSDSITQVILAKITFLSHNRTSFTDLWADFLFQPYFFRFGKLSVIIFSLFFVAIHRPHFIHFTSTLCTHHLFFTPIWNSRYHNGRHLSLNSVELQNEQGTAALTSSKTFQ